MLENAQVNRKIFLNNALNLVRLTKGGKQMIFSAEANRRIFMRAPLDVMQIAQMVGLNQEMARKSIRENCANVVKHAHCRKTYKGVAEIK